MKQGFIDYEFELQMFMHYGADAHARYMVGEPIKPEGYDEYKKAEKEKIFQVYENELATFLRLNVRESVTNEAIKPKKPEGYDTYKKEVKLQTFKDYDLKLIKYHRAIDNNEKEIPEEPKKPEGYAEYVENYNKQFLGGFTVETVEVDITKGYVFDAEGIPQYLSADDVYNGIENPEWTKKHKKPEVKPYVHKEESNKEEEDEEVYNRYSGLSKYLSESDRKNGIINLEWIMEHRK